MQSSNQNISQATTALIFLSILFLILIVTISKLFAKRKSGTAPKVSREPAPQPVNTINQTLRVSVASQYRYTLRRSIMTPYEQKIFLLLTDIFSSKCYVIPQVHLSSLFDHEVKGQNWQGAFSHINSKSVDFVLLRKSNLSPICAIELDDWSHQLEKRQERDKEVERIFSNTELPLIRFKNIDQLSKQEIVNSIATTINTAQSHF